MNPELKLQLRKSTVERYLQYSTEKLTYLYRPAMDTRLYPKGLSVIGSCNRSHTCSHIMVTVEQHMCACDNPSLWNQFVRAWHKCEIEAIFFVFFYRDYLK